MDAMSTTLMTFAEFELLPEIDGKRELVDGEVAIMPPPELAHSRIAKRILLLFLARLDQSRVCRTTLDTALPRDGSSRT
jgi:Uma2 family endonuclease